MNEFIPISNHNGKQAVSARALYEFLGLNKAVWKRWYEKNITNNVYAFENEDYVGFNIMLNGNESKDFALSINFAKKISMQAKTQKGEDARNYFIECERIAITEATKPAATLSTLDFLELTIKGMREQNAELQEVKRDVLELKAKTQTNPDYFTIVGYGTLNGMKINLKEAALMGGRASRLCKARGIKMDSIPDPRFGTVRLYPRDVLEEVFNQPIN